MKILILITAFNVSKYIKNVVSRIPKSILKHKVELLIIDDCSKDNTLEEMVSLKKENKNLMITILSNPSNLSYGGNQKIGYQYAIKNSFDFVVLLHGDGQYAPEKIGDMLSPLIEGCDAVQGSRMIYKRDALKGRMPIYKFFGNIGLTFIQNKLTNMRLSEFHSGYRAYRVSALKKIPFHLNSSYFEFDTEILIQCKLAKMIIKEIPIPTFYGDEISYLNCFKYGFRILKTTFISFLNRYGVMYNRKYDIYSEDQHEKYRTKIDFDSTHKYAVDYIENKKNILDIACGNCEIGIFLKDQKNCNVIGIDQYKNKNYNKLDKFNITNLDNQNISENLNKIDYILLLDIIEHIKDPEKFMENLHKKMINSKSKIILSTPNVAHLFVRVMLLFGQFNYGKSGILDKTHTRLFTKKSIIQLIEYSNFKIISSRGVPIPFPLIIKNKLLSKLLLLLNNFFISLNSKIFSFQFIFVIEANPSLDLLLKNAVIRNELNGE